MLEYIALPYKIPRIERLIKNYCNTTYQVQATTPLMHIILPKGQAALHFSPTVKFTQYDNIDHLHIALDQLDFTQKMVRRMSGADRTCQSG